MSRVTIKAKKIWTAVLVTLCTYMYTTCIFCWWLIFFVWNEDVLRFMKIESTACNTFTHFSACIAEMQCNKYQMNMLRRTDISVFKPRARVQYEINIYHSKRDNWFYSVFKISFLIFIKDKHSQIKTNYFWVRFSKFRFQFEHNYDKTQHVAYFQ